VVEQSTLNQEGERERERERERENEYAPFLSGSSEYGMVLPTFRPRLPLLVNYLWKYPHRHNPELCFATCFSIQSSLQSHNTCAFLLTIYIKSANVISFVLEWG
jgi:hypothetical protein